MQTVVLAAGRGTRMGPLTDRRPKPMLPVADRPLVAHAATAAVEAGATRLVVVVGYEGDAIRDFLRDKHDGVPITYAEQPEQHGTADAVEAAQPFLDDGPFAVLNGDALYDRSSLTALYDAGPAVGGYRVADPGHYGVLKTTERDGITVVTGVSEKPSEPASDLINAGAYVFPADATDILDVAESERGERELTDVLERIVRTTDVQMIPFNRWLDVGYPWDLLEATELCLSDSDRYVAGDVHPDAELRGSIVVEAGATVDSGVVIEGPAMVRKGAEVGPNGYVRGATLVGPNATIGHAVEVKNSVLMQGATVGHLSYIGDSVLGRDVNLGAGTTVANLRHDGADVSVHVKGEAVSTGRRKFGVVCGDGVRTGIHTSLNAGVTVPTDGRTAPNETVLRDPKLGDDRRE